MNIMVVAERKRLRPLVNILAEMYPDNIVIPLDDGMSAVQFAFNNPVDMVYTELQTPITGLDVARRVRKERPHTAIYLIADTTDYVSIVARHGYSGYYLNPVSIETLRENNLLAGEETS